MDIINVFLNPCRWQHNTTEWRFASATYLACLNDQAVADKELFLGLEMLQHVTIKRIHLIIVIIIIIFTRSSHSINAIGPGPRGGKKREHAIILDGADLPVKQGLMSSQRASIACTRTTA
jgi:hypothetical protein